MAEWEVLYDGPYDEEAIRSTLSDPPEPGRRYVLEVVFKPNIDVAEVYYSTVDGVTSELRGRFPGVMLLDITYDEERNSLVFTYADDPIAVSTAAVIIAVVAAIITIYLGEKGYLERIIVMAEKLTKAVSERFTLVLVAAILVALALILSGRR